MAWNLNDAAKQALLSRQPSVQAQVISDGISFGDGDGTGGRDTINASSGLDVFGVHDHILVIGGTHNNKLVAALSVAADLIEVPAGTFTDVSAGTSVCLVKLSSGSFSQVFKNGVMQGRTGPRPTSANSAESGTLLITLTRNGGAFVAGQSANGINFGAQVGNTLKRAIDPATGMAEVMRGLGVASGACGHVRLYANDFTTGASTSTPRMDGVVAVSGGDVNLTTGVNIISGVASEVTDAAFTMAGV